MPNLTVGTIVMKDRATLLIAKPFDGPDAGLWTIPDGLVSDGESIRDCSIRSTKEQTGITIEPQMSLFMCERVVEGDHRIGYFVLASPVGLEPGVEPQAVRGGRYAEVKWVDVRALGEIQKSEGMSDFTADAFVKFSNFLRGQAAAAPRSGAVN